MPEVDCDTILGRVSRAAQARQALEWAPVLPLSDVVGSHVIVLKNIVRERVWRVLASGSMDKKNARKVETIYGWNEAQFRAVFDCFGGMTAVTARKNSPTVPPLQPPTFEAAWGAKRKRELQTVLTVGPAMESFCKFQDFNTASNPTRFYYGHGRKEVGVKVISEIAAIFTVDTRRRPGKETRVQIFVSTCRVSAGYHIEWSHCGYPTNHQIDDGDECTGHVLSFYERVLKTNSSRASEVDTVQTASEEE